MKHLIKLIECADCEMYAIKHHQRIFIGKAIPKIEIYQNVTTVNRLGATGTSKTYEFSLIICPNPEIDAGITRDFFDDIQHFDIKILVKRKDGVFEPIDFAGLNDYDIDTLDEWVFNVNDYKLTKMLMEM